MTIRKVLSLPMPAGAMPPAGSNIAAYLTKPAPGVYGFQIEVHGFTSAEGAVLFGEVMKGLMGALLEQPQMVDDCALMEESTVQ